MIRKAMDQDIDQILKVIQDAKGLFKSKNSPQWQDDDGYPNEETFREDISNDYLYIDEIDGKVIAVCCLSKHSEISYKQIYDGEWLNHNSYYTIHRLAVKKEYYGFGIAKKLLIYMETIAVENNVFNIRADTALENTPMNNLLKSLGYQYCGYIYLEKASSLDRKRLAYHKCLNKI